MTIIPQLLYAYLSMDSYHRGAAGGLNGSRGPAVPASAIDGWTALLPSEPNLSTTIGFSATAYQKGHKNSGQVHISRRRGNAASQSQVGTGTGFRGIVTTSARLP